MSEVVDIREDLKTEQREAFDMMLKFISGPDYMFLLGGYAGTGKTYTIVKLIKYLLSDKSGEFKIGMSAPTNKAVRVLRTFMSMMDQRVAFATIHSMLGLREKINYQGEQVFERDYKVKTSIQDYSLLIIDESSMLSDDLFTHLEEYKHLGLKIIFMGDPAQIPPVNKPDSIPMSMDGRRSHGIYAYMLKNIVRQKEGSPLIEMTMSIREDLNDPNSIRIPKVKQVNGEGLEFIDNYDTDAVELLFEKYFISDEFKDNADFAKVVAWTNRTVDGFNNKIRIMIYGEDCCKVEVGEKLIANKPIFNDDEDIIFQTSDEFEVETVSVQDVKLMGTTLEYYKTDVKFHNYFTGQLQSKTINILHENSAADYKRLCDKLRSLAKKHTPGTEMARKGWVAFYQFQKVFADVKYNYAITAHKSQGSTYDNVILVENDINFNRRIVERNRIKYTAASRPSKNLHIIN